MKHLITCVKQQLILSSDVHQQYCMSTLLMSPIIFRQISHDQQNPFERTGEFPHVYDIYGYCFPPGGTIQHACYNQYRRIEVELPHTHICRRNNAGLLDEKNTATELGRGALSSQGSMSIKQAAQSKSCDHSSC